MSVVGFDIGYQSCYIAVARHGGVEVIANEYSDRRTPTMVALGHKQRLMGISAKNQWIMNFKSTVFGFKVLLGRKFSDPYVQEEIKKLPFAVVQRPNDGIGIKVTYGDSEQVFTPEQVTAMMLTYLKKVAENALGKPVVDCVVSVPSYFCDSQRRALLDACTIAGLNCLRLLNDTTAIALAYGIYKQDLPAENEKPRNVAFVDLGHSSLQVTICSFQKGRLKVLCKSFDPGVGGRDFDQCLLVHFAAEFKKKYKIDTMSRPKQRLRLTTECEKLKKLLSTVTVQQSISIECFADDKDVAGTTNRNVFIEMCGDFMDRVRKTIEEAIATSGLSLSEIDAVEIVGGSCRIPMVKDVIADTFKREFNTTLNLDEAVARGCALQCAILSPSFKVRDFSISDTQPFPIKLKWQAAMEGEEGEMLVIKKGDAIYHSKILTFYRKEPFFLEAVYSEPDKIPISDPKIGTFHIKDVTPTGDDEASKVKVKVRLSINGTFFVKSATMVEKVKQVEVELPTIESMETNSEQTKTEPTADVEMEQVPSSDTPADGGEQGQSPPGGEDAMDASENKVEEQATPSTNPDDEEQATPTKEEDTVDAPENPGGEQQATPNSDSSPDLDKKTNASSKEPEAKKPKKPTVRYVDLQIVANTPSLPKKELDRANEKEVNMNYQDQLEREKADARNAVEEYVYNMRDKIEYSLSEFISDKDKDEFKAILNSTEDWLYEDGEDQPKKVYVERLTDLQKYGSPMVKRQNEFEERPRAFDELGSRIVHYEKIVVQYESGDEVFNHLDSADMDKVKEQVLAKRQWHNTQMQACQSLGKSVNPPVTCAQIRAELKNLDTLCNTIVTKPKPKVEPPKDEPPKEEAAKEEGGTMEEAAKQEGGTMEEDTPTMPPGDAGQEAPSTEDMDLD